MKQQIIPENAGSTPATHENPAAWKPAVEVPSAPEEIPMPPEMVANQAGCYPPGCNSQKQ